MGRYYTVAIKVSSGEESRELLGFDSLSEAESNFYSWLAESVNKDDVELVTVMLIDWEGIVYKREHWEAKND